jgi:MYXO-CTERM domain-containing protein
VYVDGLNAPKLTVPLDLPGTIALTGGTDAYVGFTAATGALANVQRHEVLSWSYVVPTPGSAALAVIAVALPFARRARRS